MRSLHQRSPVPAGGVTEWGTTSIVAGTASRTATWAPGLSFNIKPGKHRVEPQPLAQTAVAWP